MSSLSILNTEYGQTSFTVPSNGILCPRGFTSTSITFPDDGCVINREIELLNGFNPLPNNITQTLTVSTLQVDERSAEDVVIAIHPTDLRIFRESTSSGTLEAAENEIVAANQFTFGETTLGKDPLTLGGSLQVLVVDGGKYHNTATGGSVTAGTDTYASTGLTGGTETPMTTGDLGRWPVNVEIPPCNTSYETFVLKKGSSTPPDDVIVDPVSGDFVVFSEMLSLADESGVLLKDLTLSPTTHSIVKGFSSESVYFSARSKLPENLTVTIGAYVAGVDFDLNDNAQNYLFYLYNMTPLYRIRLSGGSSIQMPVSFSEGCYLPSGFQVPVDSNVGLVDGTIVKNNLQLSDVVAKSGTVLVKDTVITDVIDLDERASVPKGLTSSLYQPIVTGVHTSEDLNLQGARFPVGSTLHADLRIEGESDVVVDKDVLLKKNSLLKADTFLPAGSSSLGGLVLTTEVLIQAGSVVSDEFEISGPFHVLSSVDNGGVVIKSGAIIRGPTVLQANSTKLPTGTKLPSPLKILQSMGVTLEEGQILPPGTHIGPSGILHGNVGFSPDGCITSNCVLNGLFTFPVGTRIESATNLGFNLPVPANTIFSSGETLPAGTLFKDGSKLPLFDISTQVGPAYSGSGNAAGSLVIINDSNSEPWVVIKGLTNLVTPFVIPEGSILSTVEDIGHTNSFLNQPYGATYASGTAPALEFDEAEWTPDIFNNDPSAVPITITPGVPTNTNIKLLTDITLQSDLLIKLSELDQNTIQFLRMGESFVLRSNLTLTQQYVVSNVNTVTWPAGSPLTKTFVLSVPTVVNAVNTTINKDIKFNVGTSEDFIYGIMSSLSTIKFPASGHTLQTALVLAVDQEVSMAGTNPTKACIDLPAGTVTKTSASIKLMASYPINGNYCVTADISEYGAFVAGGGMKLQAGQETPGDIRIGANEPLPPNIQLSSNVVVGADHVINEDTFTLLAGSVVKPQSVFAMGTYFENGMTFVNPLVLGAILCLSTPDVFEIYENDIITATINYPYLFNSVSGSVATIHVDARDTLIKIAELLQENLDQGTLISTLQSAVASLQAAVAALQNA